MSEETGESTFKEKVINTAKYMGRQLYNIPKNASNIKHKGQVFMNKLSNQNYNNPRFTNFFGKNGGKRKTRKTKKSNRKTRKNRK
jgi:hypothetical protein